MSEFRKIYESEAMAAYHVRRDSPWTLVLFESGGLTGQYVQPLRSFVGESDLSVVTVIAHRRSWYPKAETLPCLSAIRETLGNEKIVTYGSSMGGYAAIKYASALGARHAIASAPQFTIDPSVIKLKPDPYVGYFDPDLHAGMEIAAPDARCAVDLIFDPTHPNDSEHAREIAKRVPCRLTHIRHAGHALETLFSGPNGLQEMIGNFLAGDLTAIVETARRNKRRSVYFHLQLYHALSDRKPTAAAWALGEALRLPAVGTSDKLARADAHMKLGQPQNATADLRDAYEAATRDPVRGVLALALADALAVMGQVGEAATWLRTAFGHAPDDDAVATRLAAALTREDGLAEAEVLLLDSIRKNDRPRAHFTLSQVLARQGKLDAAIAAALRAYTITPTSYTWRSHLAALLSRAGREVETEALLIGALHAIGDGGCWFGWSRHLLAKGRPAEALKAAQRAISLQPSWMALRQHLAMLLVKSGRADEALMLCHDSVRHWHGGGVALIQLAEVQEQTGQLTEAAASIRKAVADEPAIPGHRAALLEFLLRNGDLDGAAEIATAAEQAACLPNFTFLVALAKLKDKQGDSEGAIEAERRALALSPDNAAIHGSLARRLLQTGRPIEAEAPAREALRLKPNVAWVHRTLVDVLDRSGKRVQAIKACREAVAVHPSAADLRSRFAELLIADDRMDEAAMEIHAALDAGLATVGLYMAQGKALSAQGDLAGAIEAIQAGLAIAPGNAGSHGLLARYLLQAGRQDEAEINAREAVRLQPKAVSLQRILSSVLESQGKIVEAIEVWKTAAALAPNLADNAAKLAKLTERLDAERQPHQREAAASE